MKLRIYIYGNKANHEFFRIAMKVAEYVQNNETYETEDFHSAIYTKNVLESEKALSQHEAFFIQYENKKRKYNKMNLYDTFTLTI